MVILSIYIFVPVLMKLVYIENIWRRIGAGENVGVLYCPVLSGLTRFQFWHVNSVYGCAEAQWLLAVIGNLLLMRHAVSGLWYSLREIESGRSAVRTYLYGTADGSWSGAIPSSYFIQLTLPE